MSKKRPSVKAPEPAEPPLKTVKLEPAAPSSTAPPSQHVPRIENFIASSSSAASQLSQLIPIPTGAERQEVFSLRDVREKLAFIQRYSIELSAAVRRLDESWMTKRRPY